VSLQRTLVRVVAALSLMVASSISDAQRNTNIEAPLLPELSLAPWHTQLFAGTYSAPDSAFVGNEIQPIAEPRTKPSSQPSPAALPPEFNQDAFFTNNDRIGSTNVPMDSWIYPALERLGSMGLIPFQTMSIRPWTRQECRRQVQQAKDILAGVHGHYYDVDDATKIEAENLLPDLERELQEPDESSEAILESTYVRVGTIAGPALTDSFHFGQTWVNDFGRPLGQGTSAIAGFSLRASHGRFFLYDRQEAQQSPTTPGVSAAQSALFYSLDNTPFGPVGGPPPIPVSDPRAAYLRQRPIELYAGVAFDGYSLSFGKQELYWGPTTMGPLSFSSNAEPTYNLRLISTRQHLFPFFPTIGTYRVDLVFGKLSGHHYPARPYFNGTKIDLTFGRLLEMSFTRWSILWGVGHPMTLHSLKDNLFSSNSTGSNFLYGDRLDPGDRKSAFDFRLHVPGLRNYLTIYADSYADDEVSPIDAPRRVVWHPGLYLARLPYLPKVDLRFEVASSEELAKDEGGTRDFINNQYRDGNTNKGFLLGNAVGRDGRAFEARSGYWVSSRTRVEAGYRQTKGSENFLPGGSTISDGFLNLSYAFTPEWSAQGFAQYERFLVPSYMPGAQHNGSGWFQLTWTPKLSLSRR
jgi:hypothetical protein